jgi:hypothetical protein
VSSVLLKTAGLLVWTAGRSTETEEQCGLLHVSAGIGANRIGIRRNYEMSKRARTTEQPSDRLTDQFGRRGH